MLTAANSRGASLLTPLERVMNARVCSAMSRVRLIIELAAREALVELGASQAVVDAATDEFEQARLRRYLAEDAEKAALARLQQCQDSGAWPFDAMRWSAWLKLSLESELSQEGGTHLAQEDAARWLQAELPNLEPDKRDDAKRCFDRVMNGLLGIAPFDPVRFERACMERAAKAAIGCGQSDVLWSRRATALLGALLARLDAGDLASGEQIARRQGWMDPEEASAMEERSDEEGLCGHGIDPHYCPAGCGDRD